MQGSLSRAYAQTTDAAFKGGNPLFKNGSGGILDPAIAKSLGFEIKQGSPMVGAVEGISHSLVNRNRDGIGLGIRLIAGM